MKVFFGLLSTLYNMYGFERFDIYTVVYRKTSTLHVFLEQTRAY